MLSGKGSLVGNPDSEVVNSDNEMHTRGLLFHKSATIVSRNWGGWGRKVCRIIINVKIMDPPILKTYWAEPKINSQDIFSNKNVVQGFRDCWQSGRMEGSNSTEKSACSSNENNFSQKLCSWEEI